MLEVPPDKLDTPTLGAWRRAHGLPHDGLTEEARHMLAVTIVQEAERRVLIERLDSIQRFLVAGATPDQAAARLANLVATWYGA